jgi:hypothetical protein
MARWLKIAALGCPVMRPLPGKTNIPRHGDIATHSEVLVKAAIDP